MSPTDAGRFTDAATPSRPPGHPTPSPRFADHASVQDDAASEGALATSQRPPRPVTRPRLGPTRNADPLRPATPATTAGIDGCRCAATRNATPPARRPMTSGNTQLSAGMTATLSAELDGRVAGDLVADIVRAVQDESRQGGQDRSVESTILEARQRLERFIRARSSK
jgi:hypothetical protein